MLDSSLFTDEDLREALKDLGSYVDITEEDLKKIYSLALKHARQRLAASVAVADAMTPKVVAVGKDDDIATSRTASIGKPDQRATSGLQRRSGPWCHFGDRHTRRRRNGKRLYLQGYHQETAGRAHCWP